MVDVGPMNDVEDMNRARGVIDAVDDPVGTAPGGVAAGQRAEERLPDAVRAESERGLAELQNGCGRSTVRSGIRIRLPTCARCSPTSQPSRQAWLYDPISYNTKS
jgi:hypothetical protein